MRQQSGLLQHQFGHAFQVIQGAGRAQVIQSRPGEGITVFRFVAEREESFLAVSGLAGARDGKHLRQV